MLTLSPAEGVDLWSVVWSVGVLRAAALCASAYWPALTAVAAVAGVAWWRRDRSAPPAINLALLLIAAGVLWGLRDLWHLSGDSRVLLHNLSAFGDALPVYRAPLTARVLGELSRILSPAVAPEVLLAAVSVLGGLATAAALSRLRGTGGTGRSVAWALGLGLLLSQPLGFVFYGHVESYALFLVLLAATLVSLQGDFSAGRPRPVTALLLGLLVLSHLAGALLLLPLAVFGLTRQTGGRRFVAGYLGLLGAGILAAAWVPGLAAHALLFTDPAGADGVDYAVDVLNGWALLVPLGLLVWRGRERLADPFVRLVGWVTLTFMLFPLLARFELGLYRDLDLLSPAFVSLVALAILTRRPGGYGRDYLLAGVLLAGSLLTAGLITWQRCPAGIDVLEGQLARSAMTSEAKAYGLEIVAFTRREQGDLAAAEDAMQRATRATPGNHRLRGALGEIQLARGDTVAALANLELALDTPRRARTAPLVAELYTRRGAPERAIAVLRHPESRVYQTSSGAAALAVAYFRVGRPDSTVLAAHARQAVDPSDAVAYFNAASGYAAQGRFAAAEHEMREAVRLEPDNVEYHQRLVRVLLQLSEGEERARRHLSSLPADVARRVTQGL